jgi:hypothetical protein
MVDGVFARSQRRLLHVVCRPIISPKLLAGGMNGVP